MSAQPHKGTANLRRGQPKGVPNPGALAKVAIREQEQRIDRAAEEAPGDVIKELFREAAKYAAGRLRKLNRQKGPPERTEVEMMRETRQLADRTFEIIEAEGRTAPAVGHVAAVDSRLATVATVLEGLARPF